jgi:undecaprenyl-diphosphatase
MVPLQNFISVFYPLTPIQIQFLKTDMSLLQSLLLGIIQGLTEFLPISSSAHLVLIPYFLGWTIPEEQIFPFDVLVQLGTLLAVILYFWRDLWNILRAFLQGLVTRRPFADPLARMGWYLILATIPAGVLGLLFKSKVEAAFKNPALTGIFLLGTALILFLAEFLGKRTRALESLTWKDSLVAGLVQAVSIFPGISRSGSAIAGGMVRHLDRPSAARFSFLMAVPVMLAAGALSIPDLLAVPDLGSFLPVMAAGFLTAAVVGYLSIHWLLRFVSRHSLITFAIYCALLGAVTLLFLLFSYTPAPQPPLPTPQVFRLEITPALDWLDETLQQCATRNNIGLDFHRMSADNFDPGASDFSLRWGAPESISGYSAVLGYDEWTIIVNPLNPLTSLTQSQLGGIYSGQVTLWSDLLPLDCPDCPALEGEIHAWMYPPGDDSLEILENEILRQPVTAPLVTLAPSPIAMLQAIREDPQALGFIPRRALDASVKTLEIPDVPLEILTHPILVLTSAEPAGTMKSMLLCLQEAMGN